MICSQTRYIALFSCILCFSINLLSAAGTTPSLVLVKEYRGTVMVRTEGNKEWQAVKTGTLVPSGAEIRTAKESSVLLRFLDGKGDISMSQGGHLRLEGILNEDGFDKVVTIETGSACFDIARHNKRLFEVIAGNTRVSVKGTTFIVARSNDGSSTAVYGIEGLVAVFENTTSKWVNLEKGNRAVSDSSGIKTEQISEKDKEMIAAAVQSLGSGKEAIFKTTSTLNVGFEGKGTVTPEGPVEVQDSGAVDLTATPAEGYYFVKWIVNSGHGEIKDPESFETSVRLFTMTGDASVKALFSDTMYLFAIEKSEHGIIEPSGEIEAPVGIKSKISAVADNGYHFSKWEIVSGEADIENEYEAETHVVIKSDGVTLKPLFENALYRSKITASEGGEVTPLSSDTLLPANSTLTLNALPSNGYSFIHWEVFRGGALFSDRSNPFTSVSITSDSTEIKALFSRNAVKLTLMDSPFGSTTPPSGTIKVVQGDTLSLEAVANKGYLFETWTILDGIGVLIEPRKASCRLVASDGDLEVKPQFVQIQYRITVESSEGGTAAIHTIAGRSDNLKVVHGEPVNLSADPANSQYAFWGWEIKLGSEVKITEPSSWYTTAELYGGDATVLARFERKRSEISFSATKGGSVIPSYQIIVPFDSSVSIKAQPGNEQWFVKWELLSGKATITDAFSSVTTIKPHSSKVSVKASFSSTTYAVSISANEGGSVDPQGVVRADSGKALSIAAPPKPGYRFTGWKTVSGNLTIASKKSIQTTAIPHSDGTIQAQFAGIAIISTGIGFTGAIPCANSIRPAVQVRPNGDIEGAVGSSMALEAVNSIQCGNGCNYFFNSWEVVSGQAAIANRTSRVTTIKPEGEAVKVRALYKKDGHAVTTMWNGLYGNIVLEGEGGNAASGIMRSTVCNRVPLNIEARAEGGVFVSWSVDYGNFYITEPRSPRTRVYAFGPGVIRANFTEKEYVLSILNHPHSTSPSEIKVMPEQWYQVTVHYDWYRTRDAVVDNKCFRFVKWAVDSGSAKIENPGALSTRVSLSGGGARIRAVFERVQFKASTRVSEGSGSVIKSGDWSADKSVWYQITAIPQEENGWAFTEWRVDGGRATIQNRFAQNTYVMIHEDNTVLSARFSNIRNKLTMQIASGGTVSPEKEVMIYDNQRVSIRAVPEGEYYFEKWSVLPQSTGRVVFENETSLFTCVSVSGGDAVIGAIFKKKSVLSVASGGCCDLTPSGDIALEPNRVVIIEAHPHENCYFEKWEPLSDDVQMWIFDVNSARTSVKYSGESPVKLTAICKPNPKLNVRVVVNGVPVKNEFVSLSPGTYYGLDYSQIYLHSGSEYSFVEWKTVSGRITLNRNNRQCLNSLKMDDEDATLEAVYGNKPHIMTIEFSGEKASEKITIQYK